MASCILPLWFFFFFLFLSIHPLCFLWFSESSLLLPGEKGGKKNEASEGRKIPAEWDLLHSAWALHWISFESKSNLSLRQRGGNDRLHLDSSCLGVCLSCKSLVSPGTCDAVAEKTAACFHLFRGEELKWRQTQAEPFLMLRSDRGAGMKQRCYSREENHCDNLLLLFWTAVIFALPFVHLF